MGYTQQDTDRLELAIIDLVETIRVEVLKYNYPSRHIKVVIPETLRPALTNFSLRAYAGFTVSIEYDPRLGNDIFVIPVTHDPKPGLFGRLGNTIRRWFNF